MQLASGPPWRFSIEVRIAHEERHQDAEPEDWLIAGLLVRGVERIELNEEIVDLGRDLFATNGRIARLEPLDRDKRSWFEALRLGPYLVPADEGDGFLKEGLETSGAIEWRLPAACRLDRTRLEPRPLLRLAAPDPENPDAKRIDAELLFDYDDALIDADDERRRLARMDERRCIERDAAAEAALAERLGTSGFRRHDDPSRDNAAWSIAARRAQRAVHELVRDGWRVEAEGRRFRSLGTFHFSVASGIDWFGLEANADDGAGGPGVDLPRLLAAHRAGKKYILLDDGSFGILPEEWLRRFAGLASLGAAEGERIIFKKAQAPLLEALLAEQADVATDAAFERIRRRLADFDRIGPERDSGASSATTWRPSPRPGGGSWRARSDRSSCAAPRPERSAACRSERSRRSTAR